ncbi:DNA-binding SARP family transcriptional activator [Asanoa ferruginea]|uniref:DNA-binding SARP family transcriptional activator n=1 Tax=Asanoa ferruginea TaxID=53367 RepID=A0A3D9ZCJ8_9ACTN|nr:BTAD domain-containing putative transcriptional regulator [Asanoa ferruginea]REF94995.1 DNA-binding SARP family transcriptional activator [Asanoa ferruginea]GIF48807.1 SARP family transcriptional regulator [Asanoa ferruginea]
MFVRSLGPLELVVCGDAVPIGTPRTRSVLAMLLARRGGLVTVDQLIDELWPDGPPADPRMLVHGQVSRLRRVLGQDRDRLVTRKPGYMLHVGEQEWDVLLFEQSIADARAARAAGQPERGSKLFGEAQRVWTGEPFADVPPTPTIAATATDLHELRLAGLAEWFELRLEAGGDPELVAELTHHVAEHPLREQLVAQLMLALHRSGRQADALATYRSTRERLVRELGAEPGAELQHLHKELLRTAEPLPQKASQLPLGVRGFVGRRAELASLDAATALATITGTAGVGKSALAVHWAHRAQDRFPDGQLFVNLRGFDPRRSALDPGEVLFGFLQALGVSTERIPSSTESRAALYRSALAGKRVLVVLDNARDIEQVRPLLPGSTGSLALVTSRDQLTGLVAVEGAHPVSLDVLTDAEAADLLSARLGQQVRGGEAFDRIVRRCAGLPLALAVVAASSAVQPGLSLAAIASDLETGALDAFGGGDPQADLRSVFSWSYRVLTADAARLFRLLGLHPGPDISIAAAASLCGAPSPVARRLLSELNRAHLVVQHHQGRFSSHDLLRAYAGELAETLDPTHREAALARLLDHYLHTAHGAARRLDPHREPITLDAAAPGAVPVALSSYGEAMAWFEAEHTLLVGLVDRAGDDRRIWKLAWTLNTYLRWRGYGQDWIRSQRAGLAAAVRVDDLVGQANSAFGLAMAEFRHGGRAAADTALSLADEHFRSLGDHYGMASVCHQRCLISESDGDHGAAFEHAFAGLGHYRLAGHAAGQGRALGAMGWFQAKQGNLRQGLDYNQAALALSQAAKDLLGEANTWDSIGHIQRELGEFDEAETAYRRSIAIYRGLGERFNVVSTIIGLGDTQAARGATGRAKDTWREARTIATDLDHPALELVKARLA